MDESPTIISRLTTALVDLGRSSAEVANTLCAEGITGRRNGAECPVTRWVQREVPEVAHLFTCVVPFGHDNLWIDQNFVIGQIFGASVALNLPPAVADFIADFDNGVYPWLIEKPAAVAA